MINLFRKVLIPYVFNDKKIYLSFISLIFFTILYALCNNDEFHGWIDTEVKKPDIEQNFTKNIFKKFSNKKNYLTFKDFEKIPIVDKDGKFYFVSEEDKEYKKEENITSKKILFRIYSVDGRLYFDKFSQMPILLNLLDGYNTPHKILYPSRRLKKSRAVNSLFDRFYFSIIVQSNLGLGDIFPASKRVRMIMILQVIISYAIIILPYGSFVGFG